MDVMVDGTPISVFPKRVKETSTDASKVISTNGLAVQVAIPDSRKAAEYTETLTKAMAYFNKKDSHPVLLIKVFLPFNKVAAIDNITFQKMIQIQNEYLHKIGHIEIHNICNIDKEVSMGHGTPGELINSTIRQILMDEVDVEGEPIFKSVERTMKDDMDRVLFTEPDQDLCKHILKDIETCMAKKFEHSDDPTAYREK
jgi:hypothetical protein